MKCSKCGSEPQETDRLAWKCTSCGKAYSVNLSYLQKLQEKKDSSSVASIVVQLSRQKSKTFIMN